MHVVLGIVEIIDTLLLEKIAGAVCIFWECLSAAACDRYMLAAANASNCWACKYV